MTPRGSTAKSHAVVLSEFNNMNVFEALKQYSAKFNVISRRNFNDLEKSQVSFAEVVASEYGLSVCFHMVCGSKTYIPVSRDSVCSIGDRVNMDTAELLKLHKEGTLSEEDIDRVEVI